MNNLKRSNMNNNLEFENEDPSPDSIEDNHPRTNYGGEVTNPYISGNGS